MILSRVEKLVDAWFSILPRTQPAVEPVANARVIAHRGAYDHSHQIMENTEAAFARAFNLGCWGIEFDVHACADQVLVINHDPTLKRLWGHDVKIGDSSFAQVHKLAPSLPSLTDIVARYGKRMHLFIELKAPFIATAQLAEALQSLTPGMDYHLLSLDATVFQNLDLFPRDTFLLVPVHNNVNKFCNLSLQQQYGGVLGHYLLLREPQIQALKYANQIAGVGFIDSKYILYRELHRGISYLFSNKVDTVIACLQELALRTPV